MTLLLDPSMLVGSRTRTWLERAHRSGVLHQVSIPASIFSADVGGLRPRGRFPGDQTGPHLDLLHDAQYVCCSAVCKSRYSRRRAELTRGLRLLEDAIETAPKKNRPELRRHRKALRFHLLRHPVIPTALTSE